MAKYYAAKYYSNGTSSTAPSGEYAAIPALPLRGLIGYWEDTIDITGDAALTTSDTVYAVRIPGGHKPIQLEIYSDGDPDTGGTSLAVNIGTTADADLIAAAYVLTAADTLHVFPQTDVDGIASGSAKFNSALFSTAAPSADYDLLIVPTANATTATSATFRIRLQYASTPAVYDSADSPAVVSGTQ